MIAVNRSPQRSPWRTRVVTYLVGACAAFAAVSLMEAPFAEVDPGPTPELTALVIAQNEPGDLDPTFGAGGKWHATTINATPLSWLKLGVCKVKGDCEVFPLSTSSSSAQQAADSMSEAVAEAALMAGTWTGGSGDYNTVMKADLGKVGGGSAGLMLTLAFIDAATDGDLTAGRVIAGTGTINTLSEVGPVTGVAYKVLGAQAAGAEVFFTPHLIEDEARKAAEGTGIEVVAVSHLPDALRWLCENGGESSVCQSPALVDGAADDLP